MTETAPTINQEERGLSAFTHLSGLAGYIIPLGGVIVPIIIRLDLCRLSAETAGQQHRCYNQKCEQASVNHGHARPVQNMNHAVTG